MIIDEYITISDVSSAEYKDRGSKFIAYAYPFDSELNLNDVLTSLKTQHIKAVHFCYAYLIGTEGLTFRINDDGEPSGSAGKPIYGQILSKGLTNVLVVVVRYFGGTKLGVPGLIEAYKESAKAALSNAALETKYICNQYLLTFGYEQMGEIMNVIKSIDLPVLKKEFTDKCYVIIELRLSQETQLLHKLKANIMARSMEEIGPDYEVPFCTIECLT
jgi:uncharacterized YigZ family protein